MWELLYIASSKNFLIKKSEENIGYCCIDDNKCLIQLFLLKEYHSQMDGAVTLLLDLNLINSASLSFKEPVAFNSCLLHSKFTQPNTCCFQH